MICNRCFHWNQYWSNWTVVQILTHPLPIVLNGIRLRTDFPRVVLADTWTHLFRCELISAEKKNTVLISCSTKQIPVKNLREILLNSYVKSWNFLRLVAENVFIFLHIANLRIAESVQVGKSKFFRWTHW